MTKLPSLLAKAVQGKGLMRESAWRWLLTLGLKIILAVGLLGWLLWSGRFTVEPFWHLQPGWTVVGLLVCQAVMLGIPMVRWHVLARAQELPIRFMESLRIGLIGNFVSIFVPAGLGVEGVRFLHAVRLCPGRRSHILSTLVMDRALGLLTLLGLAVGLGGRLVAEGSGEMVTRFMWLVGGVELLLLGGLATLWVVPRRWGEALSRLRFFGHVWEAFATYRQRGQALGLCVLLSLVGHLASFTAAFLGFRALGIDVPMQVVYPLTAVVNLSSMLPLTPLGLGVSDTLAASLYAMMGVLHGGVEVNMLLRLLTLMYAALSAIGLLWPGALGDDVRRELQPSLEEGG
jgi:glycosyltransferase 2 family protein